MEDLFIYKLDNLNEQEADDDTLSFCDLPLSTCDSPDEKHSFLSLSSSYTSDDTLFEFSSSDLSDYPIDDILFCGKLISPKKDVKERKSFKVKSSSVNWVKSVEGKLVSPKLEAFKFDIKKSNSVNWAKRVPGKSIFTKKVDGKKLPSNSNSFNMEKRVQKGTANQQWPMLNFGPGKGPASKQSSTVKNECREKKMKREKRLWGLIKVLGCGGGYHAVA